MASNLSSRTSIVVGLIVLAVVLGGVIGYTISGRGSDDRLLATLPGAAPVTSPSALPTAGLTDAQRTAFLDGFMKQGRESCLEQARVASHGKLSDDRLVTYCDCTMSQMKSRMTDDEIQAVIDKGMEEMTAFTGRNLSAIVKACAPT